MSVSVDLYLGPASGRCLDAAGFEALVVDLIRSRIVTRPCALVLGDVPHRSADLVSFELERAPAPSLRAAGGSDAVMPARPERGPLFALYRGERSADLLAALRRVPFGRADLCVWFQGLDWENEALGPVLEEEGYANGEAALYAFRTPRALELQDGHRTRTLAFAQYLAVSGTGGPLSLEGTPGHEVLERHLGALTVGASCI